MKLGDRVLEVDGRKYGSERVNFRDLFFVFEGAAGHRSCSRPGSAAAPRPRARATSRATLEEPGDALVWKSARVVAQDGKAYGYAHIWGM